MVKKAVGLFFLTLLTTLVAGAPGFGQKLVTIKVSATGLLVDAPLLYRQGEGLF